MLMRLLVGLAGLIGACGVAAAAAASHAAESRNLAAIAAIALAHGPALLAIGLAGRSRPLALAGALLGLGTVLFCADLAMREFGGQALFPGAAPFGGGAMMLGWLSITAAGLLSRPVGSK